MLGITTSRALSTDVFMVRELQEGGLTGVQGLVKFATAFNLGSLA